MRPSVRSGRAHGRLSSAKAPVGQTYISLRTRQRLAGQFISQRHRLESGRYVPYANTNAHRLELSPRALLNRDLTSGPSPHSFVWRHSCRNYDFVTECQSHIRYNRKAEACSAQPSQLSGRPFIDNVLIGLKPGDVHLNISSPGWAKHAWSCFFAPWVAGATVIHCQSNPV